MIKKTIISNKSKKITVILSILCVCILTCIIVALILNKTDGVSVNGSKILISELALYAEESRAAVAAKFAKENNINETGKSFWSTEYNGKTPYDALFENAVNQAAQNIIILQQAQRLLVDAPADYRELTAKYETEMKNKKTGSEISYGPENLTLLQYQASIMQACTDDIKAALLNGEAAPSLEDLQKAFSQLDSEIKSTDFTASGFVYTAINDTLADDIIIALKSGKSDKELGEICEKSSFAFSSAEVHREDVNQNILREMITENGENVPFIFENQVYVITKLEGGQPLTLEQAPRLAESKYINDVFDKLIADELEKAKIIIDKGAKNAFIKALEK